MTTGWFRDNDCRIEDFRALVEPGTRAEDYPHADTVESDVLVYGKRLTGRLDDDDARREVQSELASALRDGPGIVVVKQAFDADTVDAATAVFTGLIAEQTAGGRTGGDHFAHPGSNDRIWAALDKFALRAPAAFARYYANDVLALVAQAWLGPNYQLTSQVNVVNPGGPAQTPHRDYHLGFMDAEQARAYPEAIHRLSPFLTLQGAVAHVDMPVESGPTKYLPHSQRYPPGYLAFHRPEFIDYFDTHHVQLPLEKGDAVFFNPALFHGAGTNRSAGIRRMANLLQVSSAFGRAMEAVDSAAVCAALFPVLKRWPGSARERANLIVAAAEGYAFPTNLDRDQPIGGLNPPTQAELLTRALKEDWGPGRFQSELDQYQERRDPRAFRPFRTEI
jgi:ectoine hydroxylase-related dioxygenase (phytanoyl-CoA dioxygenase family)